MAARAVVARATASRTARERREGITERLWVERERREERVRTEVGREKERPWWDTQGAASGPLSLTHAPVGSWCRLGR